MRKLLAAIAFVAFLLGMTLDHFTATPVHAQTAVVPALLFCNAAHTTSTCPAFPSGVPSAMIATDGFWFTENGTSPVNLAASSSISLTLNNVTKTLPASFTVATSAPTATATATVAAPPVTVQ